MADVFKILRDFHWDHLRGSDVSMSLCFAEHLYPYVTLVRETEADTFVTHILIDNVMAERKEMLMEALYYKLGQLGKSDKRVCTCGAGYFCTFECETCDAFKEPEETDRKEQK